VTLHALLSEHGVDPAATQPLFRNRRGDPLTRFGVRYLLRKYAHDACATATTRPQQHAEQQRNDEGLADPHVGRARAAEVPGQKDRPQHGRARHDVDGRAEQLEHGERREHAGRIPQPIGVDGQVLRGQHWNIRY